ncbi:MAG: SDR family oxidoreductase [Cytophagales bacterium]|nr:SDR family oxidoreductase [Cytophagales bacterium]
MSLSKNFISKFHKKYGEWAVITGASSGIGKWLAIEVAKCGINVLLVARNTTALERLKEEIQKKYQVKAAVLGMDLGADPIEAIINATQNKNVGLLIANAGFGTSGYFINSSIHEELNMLEVNCRALLEMTHYFSQYFAEKQQGGIILMSSMVGFQGTPYTAHYAATKAYVQSLAEGLYHELKEKNVDVLAAAPGPVATSFAKRANMVMDGVMKPEDLSSEILKALGSKMTVLPGGLTKLLVYSLRTVQRWAKIRIMKLVMGGMTKHQQAT